MAEPGDGKKQTTPTFRAIQYKSMNSKPNFDFELLAAAGKPSFKQGDFVDMDLELITLPCSAADYYGPNESFRKHLLDHPSSWKTAFREAQGNDLKVTVAGGNLLHRYPVVVQATAAEVVVDIRGGVGAVPISFAGLTSVTGHTLYREVDGERIKFAQAVHGNDFWQTDSRLGIEAYKVTFNLLLNGGTDRVGYWSQSLRKHRLRVFEAAVPAKILPKSSLQRAKRNCHFL